ncbi:PRK06851 family protein [Paenibacillus apiarius]|uniref:PRK06851 family protein n=1 Tax=Paenibacillus apiarius TaxID=46240 RepID=UPI003B3A7A9F
MNRNAEHFFATGNTGRGVINHYDSMFEELDYLYILKGVPGNGKSTVMKNIGEFMQKEGYHLQMVHSAFNPKSLDAIIIPELGIGIADGSGPHVIEPKIPGISGEYVNIGEACNTDQLRLSKDLIAKLHNQFFGCFNASTCSFSEALQLHDDLEHFYIQELNIPAANQLSQNMIQEIFPAHKLQEKAIIKHRFFGSATYNGPVDFLQSLTEHMSTRYFIKGRPGSGKSRLMKSIIEAAEKKGFDVEVYYCDFDPDSIDVIIIPELSVAAFDSTPPHEYFPEREGDQVIDTYSLLIQSGTDEKYEHQIKTTTILFEAKIEEATQYLKQAKKVYDELEAIYVAAVDFNKVKEMEQALLEKIMGLSNRRM